MKTGLTFLAMLIVGSLFLGFDDVKTAHEKAIPIESLTTEQDLWARKYFALFDNGYYYQPFIGSNDVTSNQIIIHDVAVYIVIIALVYMIWERASMQETRYTVMFLTAWFIDAIDYGLTHNNPWFHIGAYPVSCNITLILIYIVGLFYVHHRYNTEGN